MKASVLWDIVSRTKIESHEAAGLQSPAPASGKSHEVKVKFKYNTRSPANKEKQV